MFDFRPEWSFLGISEQTVYIRIQFNEIYKTVQLLSWNNVYHFLTEPETWIPDIFGT